MQVFSRAEDTGPALCSQCKCFHVVFKLVVWSS